MISAGILYGSVFLTLISPLIAAILLAASFLFKRDLSKLERLTYRLVRFFFLFTFCCSLLALIMWPFFKDPYISKNFAQFHLGPSFSVNLRLFCDRYSLIFLTSSAFITAIITFFSHRYLHRDPGYRRFFIVISLFAFGINLICLAGTFDLIFAAWEILGLASFLLIGYFWHRPKAIAAACRAYYIYRITDLGLLASLPITHYFWHDLSIFADFVRSNSHSVFSHVPSSTRWLLSLCILLPVLGKSAQFPFSFWLPKAMEGPTHSSAIFYGSLSIHAGVFLLIRTMPIWYYTPGFPYLLAGVGLITATCATLCAFVQSNIKGQIGYASIAQVGLMLIELSFGLENIAFTHMIGNAFLRCFQLLVSSSILTTHLHMQHVVRTFKEFELMSLPNLFPKSTRPSIYVFAMNDGFFESTLNFLVVRPCMSLARMCNSFLCGKILNFINRPFESKECASKKSFTVQAFSPVLPVLLLLVVFELVFRSNEIVRLFSLIASLAFALGALGEQKNARRALLLGILGNLFAFLSITNSKTGLLYLIGLFASSLIALEAFRHISARRTVADLLNHHGLYQQFPRAGFILLVGVLGIVCFPFSSTFYGEDILLSLSLEYGIHYLIIFQIIFIIVGITVIRFYSLVMFGRRDNVMKEVDLDFSPYATMVRLSLFILGNSLAFWLALS